MKTLAKTGPATVQLVEAHVPAVTVPGYWDEACKHLARRDRVMRKLIPQFGDGRLQSRGDAFTTLARSIVGQQISVKAAQSVWNRFAAAVGGVPTRLVPTDVLALQLATLRESGLSAADIFGALTKPAEPIALEIEETAKTAQPTDDDDLSELGG